MTDFEVLPFGTRTDKFECVFVWIYAKNCTPYQNYPYNDIPNVSLVFAEMRFDGLLGAVGGAVEDDDESLEIAIQRESVEEIAYQLDTNRLEPLLTLRLPSGTINHSFSLEVTYQELLNIRNNAHNGVHFSAENAGVNLLHTCRYTKGRGNECGYNNIIEQKFIGTALVEYQELVKTKNLLVSYV